ncbi:MAG: hypothetical protein EXR73_12695 [Myxococcales bacterium]|nr:hypothetical protein [Myxococcales bacterium]
MRSPVTLSPARRVVPFVGALGVVLGVAFGAGCEGRFFYDGPRILADAGPDQMARELFVATVAPIMAMKCDSCHKTAQLLAPLFESTYDSVTAHMTTPPDPAFLHCSRPDSSLFFTKGMHAGPPFDAITESPLVSTWLALWAMTSPACAGMLEEEPATAPVVLENLGSNELDLSPVGVGLEGAKLRFTLASTAGGLLLSSLQLVAGPGGLHVINPRFETCPMPPDVTLDMNNSFSTTDLMLDADETRTLLNRSGFAQHSLTSHTLGVPLAIRFDTITPMAGSAGPAVDNGGACLP